MPLTAKQAEFVRQYLLDANATQAAARAGYKQPHVQGPRLLANVSVRAAIDEAVAARAKRARISADQALQEIAKVAFFNPLCLFSPEGNLLPVNQWPPEAGAAVKSIDTSTSDRGEGIQVTTKRITLWDKPKALEMLGKHLRLFDRASESDPGEVLRELRKALAPTVGPPSLRSRSNTE